MLAEKDDDKNERVVYYLRKRFHDYERYTPIVKARKTIKGSVASDFCAENPIEGENGKEDFLDEDVLDIKLRAWTIYFDGAVNQYGNGIGVLLTTPNGSHIRQLS